MELWVSNNIMRLFLSYILLLLLQPIHVRYLSCVQVSLLVIIHVLHFLEHVTFDSFLT